jgi:ribonucleoside-triphosphate reductase
LKKERKHDVFSSSGVRLSQDVDGDWETDTLRTGLLGTVTLNIPRIVYETGKDKARFFEGLREKIEMASRALDIKYAALRSRGHALLPFIMQGGNGDQYFRLEKCSRIINMAGFREAAVAFSEGNIDEEKTLAFVSELEQNVSACARKIGKRRGKRVAPGLLLADDAAERLAQADIEKYGVAKVKFSGTRDRPFYSTASRLTLGAGKLSTDTLTFEGKTKELQESGSLAIIGLGEIDYEPSDLMAISMQLLENHAVTFFAYERKLTYCANCKKSWFGALRKCPACGAIGTLTVFDRFAGS